MTKIDVIENKISAARKYLSILDGFLKYSREELEGRVEIKGAVERYMYLAMQSVIDLAEAFGSFKKFRKPTTMSESFYILEEEKVIPLELVVKLASMVGFRNIRAHDYERVDYDIVYDALHNRLTDLESFIQLIEKGI